MSAWINHRSDEQGPIDAGRAYSAAAEQIALRACAGELPSEELKQEFYAAHAGIFDRARRASERWKTEREQQLVGGPNTSSHSRQ